ncbi:hypothetical protein F2P81_015842 [Scophthalmus maximus]|uniref:Uncharacterized protein n=1 Tax=Scophthalmus maximus TaxID=52904 RepID=A0A6A4SDJ1_SCOMX|nr:hypothetical protein F2P81_015842 [Scophthalmus maximus]
MAAPPLGSAAERHWTEEKERALIAFFSSESTPPTATCQLRGFNLRLQLPDFVADSRSEGATLIVATVARRRLLAMATSNLSPVLRCSSYKTPTTDSSSSSLSFVHKLNLNE